MNEAELTSSLAVAAVMTGVSPVLERSATAADGWLACVRRGLLAPPNRRSEHP